MASAAARTTAASPGALPPGDVAPGRGIGVEPVEFEPAHPDVEQRRRKRIEAKLAARRRKHRSASRVTHRETLEAQTHAPGIVHEIGGSEHDGVTVADALLE
jgi:hypothetical protein